MIQVVTVTPLKLQVAFSGSIYVEEAKAIGESLNGYINKGYQSISIDLSGVDYIDGTGLGALVSIHARVRGKGGNVEIKGLHGITKELFELTQLNKVFDIK
jgi:anti-sigma B factor antagonist